MNKYCGCPVIYLGNSICEFVKEVKYLGVMIQGRPQDLAGGGGKKFFIRFGNLHVAKRHAAHGAKPCALLGGFGGMPPEKFFLKWSNLVRFGVYFDQILSLKNFNNYHFLYKN